MGGAGAVPDFTPFFQRAKDKKPDVFFVFVPAGDHAAAVVKTYGALGMRDGRHQADRTGRHHPGHQAAGHGRRPRSASSPCTTTTPISTTPRTRRFVAAWKKDYGADSTPDFMAVGGYDGMAAIVHAIQATKGKMDGDEAVDSLKGWKFNSPRGPIMIDPVTRDIVMNEYLSEVVMGTDGKLHQKVIGQIDNVKDTCKELKIGPCARRIDGAHVAVRHCRARGRRCRCHRRLDRGAALSQDCSDGLPGQARQ